MFYVYQIKKTNKPGYAWGSNNKHTPIIGQKK
jgi:hypothetical protein